MISSRVFQLLVDRSEGATDILPPEEIQAEQMLAAGGIFPIGTHYSHYCQIATIATPLIDNTESLHQFLELAGGPSQLLEPTFNSLF